MGDHVQDAVDRARAVLDGLGAAGADGELVEKTIVKLLKRQSPGLRAVVSYADLKEGHTGIIYQATNFYYLGPSKQRYFKVHGVVTHPRTLYDRHGPQGNNIA